MKKLILLFVIPFSLLRAQVPDFSLVGFATLNGGTTGGEGGLKVYVTTYADLKKYAETTDTKYLIYITDTIRGTGSIANKDYRGSINVKSNKSIIGLGNSAFLDGIGFTIKGVKNVIIQNIAFSFVSIGKAIPPGSEDIWATNGDGKQLYSKLGDEGRAQIFVNAGDLISITSPNDTTITTSNIWIDHCEFYSEDPRVQTNEDLYDGLIDITKKSQYVTVSWCYFHDHHKCTLIGSSDTDLHKDRKVTLHHNYYRNISARTPFIRGSTAHFFNNYNFDVRSNVNTRMEACVRVEANYFENCRNTVHPNGSILPGYGQRIENKEVNCTNPAGYAKYCIADIPYVYSNVLTSTIDSVKWMAMNYAGIGKIASLYPTALGKETMPSHETITTFPNPCKEQTTISVSLVHPSFVRLSLIDLHGKQLMEVPYGFQVEGFHEYTLNTENRPSRIYLIVLHINDRVETHRLIIAQ